MPSIINKLTDSVRLKVKGIVRKFDSGAKLEVYKSSGERIHIIVVSEKFEGKSLGKRDQMVWKLLEPLLLPSEALSISMCLLLAPSEMPIGAKAPRRKAS